MSVQEAEDAKQMLLQRDSAFRELAERHDLLDDRLHALGSQSYLSDTDLVEEIALKKRKLALKDRMEHMVHAFVRRRVAPPS
jgi:uncharacterized protein YdcH (DUF465 family)